MQSHFYFHLEVVTEPGRLGLTTSQVTAGITVENSPEIYGGELTDAVKPSQLTWLIQTSQWIKLTEEEEEWSLEWIHMCSYFFLFAYGSLWSLPSQSDGETLMKSV